MSRSFRKPYIKDGYGSKWKKKAKADSNRIVRRKLKDPNYEIADGMSYKNGHGLNRWDICDYRFKIDKPKDEGLYYGDFQVSTKEEMEEAYRKATTK